MNIHVDTLEYANDLQKAGIERAHAEAIARVILDARKRDADRWGNYKSQALLIAGVVFLFAVLVFDAVYP